jgi:hypothetical protein
MPSTSQSNHPIDWWTVATILALLGVMLFSIVSGISDPRPYQPPPRLFFPM